MRLDAIKTSLKKIQRLRALYLQEMNAQIRYNAVHERGWSDSYLLTVDDVEVGYASIKARDADQRDTLFELYIVPLFRSLAGALCGLALSHAKATHIECQSNDRMLSSMLFERTININSEAILFEAGSPVDRQIPGAVVRSRRKSDRIFEHTVEPVGDFVVDVQNDVVATGGFLLHYNEPFADLYMEVREDQRRRGLGSYLVQELITQCYLAGRVPAARCGVQNVASRATLVRAGMRVCGFMLIGELRR